MTLGVLVVLLPLLACAACFFFMCRPRSGGCHTDAGQEQGQLRDEITALRAQLAAPDRDPVQSR